MSIKYHNTYIYIFNKAKTIIIACTITVLILMALH